MRVVFVSNYDAAGQRFNGLAVHRSLIANGIESDYIVFDRSLTEPRIHQVGPGWLRACNSVVVRAERLMARQSDWALLGNAVVRSSIFRQANIVHLQLLHAKSQFSLRHLPGLCMGSRSIIWTLHDPWITTGHCVHSMGCERWLDGCGSCPDLTSSIPIAWDRTAANWRFKRKLLSKSPIHLIVASQWMAKRVSASPILRSHSCHVIPFGVNPLHFQPRRKTDARVTLGIPAGAKVLAVRWAPGYTLKGTSYAEMALMRLPKGVVDHVICFDAKTSEEVEVLRPRYGVTIVRSFDDPQAVAIALAAADVFVMPSLGETFGMMAVEAMACGTPPIVFSGTSLSEVVDAPRAGIEVPSGSSDALQRAIVDFMHSPDLRLALTSEGLRRVRQQYLEEHYVSSHIELYRQLSGGRC